MGICSPCLKCPYKGCGSFHNKCQDYLEFKEKVDKENQSRKKAKEFEHGYMVEKRMKLDKMTKYKRSV